MMAKPLRRLIDLDGPGRQPPPPPRDDVPLLTMTDAALRLHVGLRTLKTLIASGIIVAIPVGVSGKHQRIPAAEIEKFRDGRYQHGSTWPHPALPRE